MSSSKAKIVLEKLIDQKINIVWSCAGRVDMINSELLALMNEITPQHLILIEGRPHEDHNAWRLEAVRWINRRALETTFRTWTVSTFNYMETIQVMEEIYRQYDHTHKILIAPTGSKLQSFAIFLFRQMHPDVQLVYPVTTEFATEYTSGCRAIWQVSIPDLAGLTELMDTYRKRSLAELRSVINCRQRGK